MFRARMAGILAATVVLVAAACSGENGETVTDVPQDQAETPADATSATSDDSSEASDPAEGDTSEGSAADADEPDDPGSSEDREDAAPADPEDAAPADPETLLASATTQLDGRSVRGEAMIDVGPGVKLSTRFDSDADGDLAATVELPPGMDPQFPDGADAEVRYVSGIIYVRPSVPAETLAELGVDEAWYVAEPVGGSDPMIDAIGSAGGVMCVFSQSLDAPFDDCDPLGETGTLMEAASEAEIVGREDVRGTEATRVRFQVSLLDLVGEALGGAPDEGEAGTAEGDDPDGGDSDPFAEGFEQFFDTGFEVDIWIDDENLIRRLTFDLASMFAGFAGPDDEVPSNLITLEFYDFDADISVDAPPPELIVDDPSLLRGDSGGGSVVEPYDDEYEETYGETDESGP